MHDRDVNSEVGPCDLTTLGIGAVVVVLQLALARRGPRRTEHRAVGVAVAAGGVLICTALLLTGHLAQRMRSPRHESFEAVSLRDLPAAVRYEPASVVTTGGVNGA